MQQSLRLGIDTRDLRTAVSGQKTYLEELLAALHSQKDTGLELVLFDTALPVYTGSNRWLKLLEHAKLHWYKQVVLPIRAVWNRCDVLFTSDYFVPYFSPGFKTVTVFHDAFFFENPEHYSPLFLKFFQRIAVPSAKRAARIVVPTNHVKQKLAPLLGVPANKLVTIYEAPKSLDRKQVPGNTQQEKLLQWGLEPGRYLLHVGMLNKRKNIPTLIKAFKAVCEHMPQFKLVLAGSFHTTPHINDQNNIAAAIRENQIGDAVVCTGYLPDEELAILYRNARLYVFPSINEGFGLPVLEAFLYGVPVLVANNSCLPEIGGDAVVSFDPFDCRGLADKIIGILSNPEKHRQLQVAGKRRLADFSWHRAAAEVVMLCRTI